VSLPGSRFRRSAQTLLSGVAGSMAVTAAGFVATPILLRSIGAERYGIFRATTDWFGYVGLMELGIGGALTAVFAKALGNDDRAGVAAGARAGIRAYLRVGFLMFAAAVLLLVAMPELIRAPKDLAGEVRAGCGVYLIGYALLPLAVFRPLAEAEQRGYIVNVLITAQSLTVISMSLGLAVAGWGLIGQFLGLVGGSVVFHLILAWDGLRQHPEIVRGPAAGPPALGRLSRPNLLYQLFGRLSLFTDNILLAAFLGPAAITPFILTQRLIQTAGAQVTAVGIAGWAGLIDLHYRGEHEVFALRLTQLTRLTGVIGAALLLPVAIWNRDLIVLWVGPDRYAGTAVTWLAAINASLQAVLGLWGWPLAASGRVRVLLPLQLVGAAVNLAASAAATAAFGPPGPLLGTSILYTMLSWWWLPRLLHREFGVSPVELIRAAGRPFLVAVPYGVALVSLANVVPAYNPGWPGWAKWAALAAWLSGAAAGYLVMAWAFALPAADRQEWLGRFSRRGIE
jgi:O-antigen/teichoic acid export membrane protein